VSNMMTHECVIEWDEERSGCSVIKLLPRDLSGGMGKKSRKILRIVDNSIGIRTRYLINTRRERYCYINSLCELCCLNRKQAWYMVIVAPKRVRTYL
jgi:hypothetical protein